jgi:hypothetical protein
MRKHIKHRLVYNLLKIDIMAAVLEQSLDIQGMIENLTPY